jgi:hypothetical protein
MVAAEMHTVPGWLRVKFYKLGQERLPENSGAMLWNELGCLSKLTDTPATAMIE